MSKMSKVTLKELLKDAVARNYAVGSFNAMDYISADAIVNAAEATRTPIILMTPDFVLNRPNADDYFDYLNFRIGRASIPIALHLDHGSSYALAAKAIHYGFSSVMFDGSSLPMEENIAITRECAKMAHAAGVSIEAEIGHVGGGGGSMEAAEVSEDAYTRPEDAERFVTETQVDALAIAIGTVHGFFKGTPKLDIPRLQEIRQRVSIPLVLHGGSGLPEEEFRAAIRNGINKVNFFTGVSVASTQAVVHTLEEGGGKRHFFELAYAAGEAAEEVIKQQIAIFGTLPIRSEAK